MRLRHFFTAVFGMLALSGAATANPINQVLIFCDPCKVTEMANYATGQGVGIRYVATLQHNVIKKFEVKIGTGGTPNALTRPNGVTDLLPFSADVNGIEPSIDAVTQGTLMAVSKPVEAQMQQIFSKLYSAKNASPSGFSPNTKVPININVLGTNAAGQVHNPVLYGAYCDGGPDFESLNDDLNNFLANSATAHPNLPQSIRDVNWAVELLRDIGFSETMGTYQSVLWGMFQPEWTAQFCNNVGDCAEFRIKPRVGQAQWQFTRTTTNYGSGQPYPSLCEDRDVWNYVFTDPAAAERLRRGLTGIGIPFRRIPGAGNTYIYVSCARVVGGPFLGCTITEEHE